MAEPRKSRKHEQTPVAALTKETHGGSESRETEQFVLTLDKMTHDVLEAVRVDTSGQRYQLSERECLALIGDAAVDDVMRGMEEAFEAGLAEGVIAASMHLPRLLSGHLSHSQTAMEQRREPISDHPRNGSNSSH
jgi:hypothetical protein